MIWENLNEQLIFPKLDVKSKEEVFEIVGQRFIDLGLCKSDYVLALKERENSFSTGLQIEHIGVAIPHTDPEHVIKEAISIATMKQPVTFYHMGTEDVEVQAQVIMMLAIPGKHHMEVLQSVILFIQDVDVIEKLLKATDSKAIIEIIKEKEVNGLENF
ncbi:MAG: PTS sugar transporter subunit IIA [Erysipelotrichaceae bacterium]